MLTCLLLGHRVEQHEDGIGAAWTSCGRCGKLLSSHTWHGGKPWERHLQRLEVGPTGWTCVSCGDYRPDGVVSVLSSRVLLPNEIPLTTSVRYCNDRPLCRQRAGHFLREREQAVLAGTEARLVRS